ncbi:MAG: PilZ domain-containing protein [Planctomycetota bacterium]|nr:PilZ domain-containing protein [Planctomycetota bacterium]
MAVSQQDIADVLGLSRTTVTKILNRDPKYSASEATRELVFSTAEKMGYDFTTIRRPFKREYGRTEINAKCDIEIVTEDSQLFDKGQAIARNIGVGGALLTHLQLPRNCLPLSKFVIRCRFVDMPVLADLTGECQVVRISDSAEQGYPELGVRFVNATVTDRKALKDFVDVRMAEQQAARLASTGAKPSGEPVSVAQSS